MSDAEMIRRSVDARHRFTASCRRTRIDHLMGDVSSDDLEARFAAERLRMLHRVMEILPNPRDHEPAFLGEQTNGSRAEARQ